MGRNIESAQAREESIDEAGLSSQYRPGSHSTHSMRLVNMTGGDTGG